MAFAGVAGEPDSAVGDDRDPAAANGSAHLVDRRELRDAHPCDDPGGADRTRPDPDLHRVAPRLHERLRTLRGGDVAADDLHVGPALLDRAHPVDDSLRVAVRGIDDDDVRSRPDERLDTLVGPLPGADRGSDPKLLVLVLARVGVFVRLLDVLDGHQPAQLEVPVHDQHLLDPVRVQELADSRLGRRPRAP